MKKPIYSDWEFTPRKDCLQTGEIIDRETLCHFKNNAGFWNDYIIQMSDTADIINGKPIHDTIIKEHPYAPWIYMGQCDPEKTVNRNPLLMPMVYVCSRYRAENREELELNIEMAKHACRQVIAGGAIPIAPHLYFPRFMDDSLPDERYFGMGAGKRIMEHCATFHVVVVDGVISEGMEEEIEYATGVLHLEGSRADYTREEAEQILANRLER